MNKNLKYSVYIVLGILVLGFILAVSSCRNSFESIPVQQPAAYQEPIRYDNDVHYHNDNTAANLAAAAAVGAAAGYNLDKTRICRKYKGETVTVIDKNGKVISTTFVPAE